MRILIADRNTWLLESILRTFAQQFSIETATTHERCNELLAQCKFDVVVISEKLADGRGLLLLGQIARDAPDTLRVFAARKSRLELLKGKLGPFGLFRTLSYPIDPRELLSALTLARAGLDVELPVPEKQVKAKLPPKEQRAELPKPAAVVTRRNVERVSLTSGDALFVGDVLKTVESTWKARARVPRKVNIQAELPKQAPQLPKQVPQSPMQVPQSPKQAAQLPKQVPQSPMQAPQPRKVESPAPKVESLPLKMGSLAPKVESLPTKMESLAPKVESLPPIVAPRRTQTPPPAPQRLLSQTYAARHAAHPRSFPLVQKAPMRTKVLLGATAAVVFLATTLTLNLLDAGAHVTSAAPRRETKQPEIASPPAIAAPVESAPLFSPSRTVARRVQPTPADTESDEAPAEPKMAASTTPIADPSTFGSEAYEPIYSQ